MKPETVEALVVNIRNHPDTGQTTEFTPKTAACPADCYLLEKRHYNGTTYNTCALARAVITASARVLGNRHLYTERERIPGELLDCPVGVMLEQDAIIIPNASDPEVGIELRLRSRL
ncbi:MAG: hypothetical protein TR69_WS6001000059 [candidate division WS6 bacterium OLB20]|uniref:Uncharacterized protein n=1 Tax=candidate division WS6 bacterium OLB20 TaxID=1617426 RepID=A0A136M138_9BACT|nr:MAG: hypothetical protein TR69_WS6001000059 [candidate division WS6 bacterium OLB20]